MTERTFEYKQVIVVRTDLGMSKGKTAVQVAHGAVAAAEKARISQQAVWKAWLQEGQKKVAVRVASEEDLVQLMRIAALNRLPHALIHDAGMTELPPGTTTVLAIGPAKSQDVDKVTADLKLL